MSYLPAYDPNNGWEPTPGDGGAGPDATPKTLYYLNDALGSVLRLVERDGRVSSRYHYDEFGIVSDQKKFDVNWPGPDNLYGYTGLGYDYYSGLTYARARYYKPELGRFISEDTYMGDIWNPQSQNGYAYVINNPMRYIDPSGQCGILPNGEFYRCNEVDTTLINMKINWDNDAHNQNFKKLIADTASEYRVDNDPSKLEGIKPGELHKYLKDIGYNPQPLSGGSLKGKAFVDGNLIE